MMRKYLILLIACIFSICTLKAQTVLLNMDRAVDSVSSPMGPNKNVFVCMDFGYGFILPPDDIHAKLNYGRSVYSTLGFSAKYKLNGTFSMGWLLRYQFTSFHIKQDEEKYIPDTIQNDVEKFVNDAFSVSFYTRINFDPHRGNTLGKYFDMGISAGLKRDKHILKNELPDRSLAKTEIKKLPYRQPFIASVFASLGTGKFALTATWRITDYFKKSRNYDLPELPRLSAGINLFLF